MNTQTGGIVMKKPFLAITFFLLTSLQSSKANVCEDNTCAQQVFKNIFEISASNKASEYDGWAQRTFSVMSLDEKIGQLFVVTAVSNPEMLHPQWEHFYKEAVDYANLTCSWKEYGNPEQVADLIKRYHIGGIIFLGRGRVESQIKLTNYFRDLSKYPLIIAQDFETCLNDRLDDAIDFPYAMTLGSLTNTTLLYEMGREVARQSKRIGVDVDFAPVVDVNTNYKNPVINLRSFGEFKENVVAKSVPYMQGLQEGGIIANAKHFPGHGDTILDSHRDLPKILKTVQELHDRELYPFKKIIDAGVLSIMTAHLEVPALEPQEQVPTSLSPAVVTDLLRKQLGFDGLIITDALIMKGVTKHHKPGEIELKALLAGNDILLCPTNVPLAIEYIKKALVDGILTQESLDEHVLRILLAKEWLLKNGGCARDVDEKNLGDLTSRQALALQEKLFSEAMSVCHSCKRATDFVADKDKYTARIQIGRPSQEFFETILNEQLPYAKRVCLSSSLSENEIEGMITFLKQHNHILITVYGLHRYDANYLDISALLKLIQSLRNEGKFLTIVLFGTPYALKLCGKVDTVLVAYEAHEFSQKAAADVILGLRQAQGVLPVTDGRVYEFSSRSLPILSTSFSQTIKDFWLALQKRVSQTIKAKLY